MNGRRGGSIIPPLDWHVVGNSRGPNGSIIQGAFSFGTVSTSASHTHDPGSVCHSRASKHLARNFWVNHQHSTTNNGLAPSWRGEKENNRTIKPTGIAVTADFGQFRRARCRPIRWLVLDWIKLACWSSGVYESQVLNPLPPPQARLGEENGNFRFTRQVAEKKILQS